TLVYFRDPEDTYTSRDNGATWQKSEPFCEYTGYPNILRLKNGELTQPFIVPDIENVKEWLK
ncbi:MAG: hypothetical protein II266_00150, partial [Clostridia bacterium]|nr:hypothetical protein [Clostridia bacterium]